MDIVLGSKVRDRVTGFKGIAVAKNEWMNGCKRIAIQSDTLKDGKPLDVEWVDIQQIEVISLSKLIKSKLGGGPQKDPKRW